MLLGVGAAAQLVGAQAGQGGVGAQAQRVESLLVAGLDIGLDVRQRDAAHAAGGVGKVFVHHLAADAQRLKDLAALVGLDGGNAHLAGDLDDAGQDGVVVVVHGGIVVFVQQPFVDQPADGLLRQIGLMAQAP